MKHKGKKVMIFTLVGVSQLISVFAQQINIKDFPDLTLISYGNREHPETIWDSNLRSINYTMPADNPKPPGDVFIPDLEGNLATGVPVIGEYTTQASADRSINVYGIDFTVNGKDNTDTKVWFYRQTTSDDSKLYSTTFMQERADYLVATVAENEPYGVYLLWIENGNGLSLPVRINVPKITWIGPENAEKGTVISVYGRNLSHNNDTLKSYIYIRPWGAESSFQSRDVVPIHVNPYKVDFLLPDDLQPGMDYEIWLHNGHGGKYGWSGPLKIHLDKTRQSQWDGEIVNVKDYGAKADGKADESGAIQTAIDAAKDGDRIFFAAGVYRISSSSLKCNKKLSFEGEGKEKSVLVADTAFKSDALLSISKFPSQIKDLKITTPKLHGQGLNYLINATPEQHEKEQGFFVKNTSFETAAFGGNAIETGLYGISCLHIEYLDDVCILNNDFTTQNAIWASSVNQFKISNNNFYGNWKVTRGNGNLLLDFPGSISCLDLSNNFFQSVDHTGNVKDGDRIMVRAIVFSGWRGGSHDRIYIGNNVVDRAGNPWDNSGEIILFELTATNKVYHFLMLDSVTMKIPIVTGKNSLNREHVIILKNTGIGQYRRILANDSDKITLDRPWDIKPDSTSIFSINTSVDNAVIYNNKIDGIPNYYEQESATSGIQLYGACFNNVIAGNSFKNVHHGIYVMGFSGHPETDGHAAGSIGNLVVNNKVSNAVYGLESIIVMYKYVMPGDLTLPIPWSSNINNVFRDNEVSNIRRFYVDSVAHGGYGIVLGQVYNDWQNPVWNGPWVRETLVDHNRIKNVESKYVWFRQHQQFCTVRKNLFVNELNNRKTSGIYFSKESMNDISVENIFDKTIQTEYSGTLSGPVLMVSDRSVFLQKNKNGIVVPQNLLIENAGTGNLDITIESDATWIKPKLQNILGESEKQNCKLEIGADITSMDVGSYSGTVTVKSATNGSTKTIGVQLLITK